MPLTDPTSGAGYRFGQKPSSAELTTIATQQSRAMDGTVGDDISADASVLLDLDHGTTYRVIGTPSVLRNIDLPMTGVATGERVFIRFDCDTSTDEWQVAEDGGSPVARSSISATLDEGLIVYFDGNNWFCQLWTANILVQQ
jgi:hypothetical protein